MTQAIFQERITKISGAGEDDCAGEEDFETVQVIAIDVKSPSKEEVVQGRENSGCGDTVVREHVRHHGDLVVNGSSGPKEEAKLLGDGS